MFERDFTPVSHLTDKVISQMVIHPTYGSLRRAADSKSLHRVVGNSEVPTIYYIKEPTKEQVMPVWTLNVLVTDVNKFLLKSMVKSPNMTPTIELKHSIFEITTPGIEVIYCDLHDDSPEEEHRSTQCIQIINGVIPFDPNLNLHRIDFRITPVQQMILNFGVPTFIEDSEGIIWSQDNRTGEVLGYINIENINQSSYMYLDWDIDEPEFNIEEFGIELIDCILQ
jgi:hypothetical protein